MPKQYIYKYDPTMLTNKTIGILLGIANEISKYVSKSLAKSNPSLFHDLEVFNRDRNNAMKSIGKRGWRGKRK